MTPTGAPNYPTATNPAMTARSRAGGQLRRFVVTFAGGTAAISSDTVGYPFMPVEFGGGIAPELQLFRHSKGFNFLFCDGHVTLVKRRDFSNPTNSWQNWNNDHEPHRETWNRF